MKATYSVPQSQPPFVSFATRICGSNCHPIVRQAVPQTKVCGPYVLPPSMDRRNRMLVPGQLPLHAWALMPVINWYTRLGSFGSTATVGSQLLWRFGSIPYPAGRSSSKPDLGAEDVATALAGAATIDSTPARAITATGTTIRARIL